jgi:hypothetical protein
VRVDELLDRVAYAQKVGARQLSCPAWEPPLDVFETHDGLVLQFALPEVRNEGVAAGKPAYTVFPDATLAEIVRARPASLTALARISGVGPTKLERYGQSVLDVVERAAPSS